MSQRNMKNTRKKRAANGSNQTDGSYTVKLNDWNLVLVNQWNSLSGDYEITLINIEGNVVDGRVSER